MASQDFFSKHWLAGVLILLFVLNAIWMTRMAGGTANAGVGEEAPGFVLPVVTAEDRAGAVSRLSLAELRGKVVLIDFWATWCSPCLDSLPALSALSRDYQDRGLVIVGVASADSPPEDIRNVQREIGLRYPVVQDVDGKVGDRYGVRSLPTLVIVDKTGKIREIETTGPRPRETLARLVEPLL